MRVDDAELADLRARCRAGVMVVTMPAATLAALVDEVEELRSLVTEAGRGMADLAVDATAEVDRLRAELAAAVESRETMRDSHRAMRAMWQTSEATLEAARAAMPTAEEYERIRDAFDGELMDAPRARREWLKAGAPWFDRLDAYHATQAADAAAQTPTDGDAMPEEGRSGDRSAASPAARSVSVASVEASPVVTNRVPPSGGDIGGPSGSDTTQAAAEPQPDAGGVCPRCGGDGRTEKHDYLYPCTDCDGTGRAKGGV